MLQSTTPDGKDNTKELLNAIMDTCLYPAAPLQKRQIIELENHFIGLQYTKGVWYKLRAWVVYKNYKQQLQPLNLLQERYFELHHEANILKEIHCEQFMFESNLLTKWEQLRREYQIKYTGNILVYDCTNEIKGLRTEKLFNLQLLGIKDHQVITLKSEMMILDNLKEFTSKFQPKLKNFKFPAIQYQNLNIQCDQLIINITSCWFIGNRDKVLQYMCGSFENCCLVFLVSIDEKYHTVLNLQQLQDFIEILKNDELNQILGEITVQEIDEKEGQINQFFQAEFKQILKKHQKWQVRDLECTISQYIDYSLNKLNYHFVALSQDGKTIKESFNLAEIKKIILGLNKLDLSVLIDNGLEQCLISTIHLFNKNQTIEEKQNLLSKGAILIVSYNGQTFAGVHIDLQFVLQIYNLKGVPTFNNVSLEEFLDQSNKVTEIKLSVLLNTVEELTEKASKCLELLKDENEFKNAISQHPIFYLLGTKIYKEYLEFQNSSKIIQKQG